jgi:hypothetical protein
VTVVVVGTVITAPVDRVWARVADFTGWHEWIPRITATVMDPGGEQGPVGAVRTLALAEGYQVRERLIARDDEHRRLAYTFAGPTAFPVRRYVGRVRVDEVTLDRTGAPAAAAYVHWSGDFDCDAADEDAMRERFASIYAGFLAALRAGTEA